MAVVVLVAEVVRSEVKVVVTEEVVDSGHHNLCSRCPKRNVDWQCDFLDRHHCIAHS